jgi:hypothetical protein
VTPPFDMTDLPINDSTFLIIAMHHYDNSQCTSIAEFEEDLKRFGYLKKLFSRYQENGELKERLIINHIIVLNNLFGPVCIEMLFFKTDKQYWNILATFLVYLKLMPQDVPEFGISLDELELDEQILDTLRKI